MITQNIPKGQISRYVPPEDSDLRWFLGATETNSRPWLFQSRGDWVILLPWVIRTVKICEICSSCVWLVGIRSFYQPPFPKKIDEDYEDFHISKLCKIIRSFTTYCVTRNQQPKAPPIKKNTKCNISSPIRNDTNSCAKDMDFVIYVFQCFSWLSHDKQDSRHLEISWNLYIHNLGLR